MNWLEIESKWREMACRAQGIKPPTAEAMTFNALNMGRDGAPGSLVSAASAARADVVSASVVSNQTTL